MKQQAIQYVALDVHPATLVVSVRDGQGAVVMRATVPTEAKAIAPIAIRKSAERTGCEDSVHSYSDETPLSSTSSAGYETSSSPLAMIIW